MFFDPVKAYNKLEQSYSLTYYLAPKIAVYHSWKTEMAITLHN